MRDVRVELRNLFEEARRLIASEKQLVVASLGLIEKLDGANAAVNLGIPAQEFPARLGLTTDQFYKRLAAARVVRRFPEFLGMLERGETHIAHLALLAPKITDANRRIIAAEIPGKSRREVELFLSRLTLDGQLIDAEESVEIRVTLTKSELALLDRAKEVLSAAGQVPNLSRVLVKALDTLLDAKDPMRKAERAAKRKANETDQRQASASEQNFEFATAPGQNVERTTAPGQQGAQESFAPRHNVERTTAPGQQVAQESFAPGQNAGQEASPEDVVEKNARRRGIPAATRHAVMLRDRGQCREVLPDGRRCEERAMIEIDHIKMVCRGGGNELGNLALKCRRHNQAAARRILGDEYMVVGRSERCAAAAD